jgi:hypothetical protein
MMAERLGGIDDAAPRPFAWVNADHVPRAQE